MIHYIYADSRNRDPNAYGNSYFLSLTSTIKNITKIDLVAAKVPNTMYNVSNGKFKVNGVEFEIPVGFYSACGLAQAVYNVSNINVDWLPDEGKFIFYSLNDFSIDVTSPDLKKALGLSSGDAVPVSNTQYSTWFQYLNTFVVKSSTLVDLTTNEFVFLDIEELRTTSVVDSKTLIGPTYAGSTIATTFGMIPLDVCSGQIKSFKEQTDYTMSIQFQLLPSISRLTVRWLDKDGKLLNFNGFDNNSFVLRVHTLDRDPEPEEPIEEELLLKKIQRIIEDTIPPPKPEPKRRIWVWVLVVILIGALIFQSRRQSQPPSNLVRIPQPPMSIHRSL